MPTRNHALKPYRFPACSTVAVTRVAVATARNVATRACPTLLVTGRLAASDATIERIGLRVSERAESVSRALGQRELSVDALIAEVTSLHMDVARQLMSLAQARRVRAAAIIYEYGSERVIKVLRRAGFDLFQSVDGQIDQAFVLAKLQRTVAYTLAAKPACDASGLQFHSHAHDTAHAAPGCPS